MTIENGDKRRGKVKLGPVIVNVSDTLMFKLLLLTIAISVLGWGIIGALTISGWNQVQDNTDKIEAAQVELRQVEKEDTESLRRAAWAGCERDMLERANDYVAAEAILKLPALVELFPPSLIEQSNVRRARSLPILDCDPNLCGKSTTILPAKAQRRFIRDFQANKLDPNPEAPDPLPKCPNGGAS